VILLDRDAVAYAQGGALRVEVTSSVKTLPAQIARSGSTLMKRDAGPFDALGGSRLDQAEPRLLGGASE